MRHPSIIRNGAQNKKHSLGVSSASGKYCELSSDDDDEEMKGDRSEESPPEYRIDTSSLFSTSINLTMKHILRNKLSALVEGLSHDQIVVLSAMTREELSSLLLKGVPVVCPRPLDLSSELSPITKLPNQEEPSSLMQCNPPSPIPQEGNDDPPSPVMKWPNSDEGASLCGSEGDASPLSDHSPSIHSTPTIFQTVPLPPQSSSMDTHSQPTGVYFSPTIGHSSPTIGHSSPTIGHSSPTISHSSPTIGHSSPTIGHSSPTIGHSPSLVRSQQLNRSFTATPSPQRASLVNGPPNPIISEQASFNLQSQESYASTIPRHEGTTRSPIIIDETTSVSTGVTKRNNPKKRKLSRSTNRDANSPSQSLGKDARSSTELDSTHNTTPRKSQCPFPAIDLSLDSDGQKVIRVRGGSTVLAHSRILLLRCVKTISDGGEPTFHAINSKSLDIQGRSVRLVHKLDRENDLDNYLLLKNELPLCFVCATKKMAISLVYTSHEDPTGSICIGRASRTGSYMLCEIEVADHIVSIVRKVVECSYSSIIELVHEHSVVFDRYTVGNQYSYYTYRLTPGDIPVE